MAYLAAVHTQARSASSPSREAIASPVVARTLMVAIIALAFAGGLLATPSADTARLIASDGGAWANLLRAMAALKMLLAGAASAAVLWRLGAPISPPRWGGYALSTAAAWAGPGLIWSLAHIPLGALLLHGGLIAMALLLWRDPAMRARLSEMIARRRQALLSREHRHAPLRRPQYPLSCGQSPESVHAETHDAQCASEWRAG